ncbi:MAG: OmpA family protein [Pseudomonadota bacterium]
MKKLLSGVIVISVLMAASPNSRADKASKEELTGVGSGAVIGGVVGGPPGIVIGAAIGAFLGDKYHQKAETIENLTDVVAVRDARLTDVESQLIVEQEQAERLRAELVEIDESGVRALYTAMDTGLSFTVPFRTNEDQPEQELVSQVNSVAATLSNMPSLGVQIDGFADARGGVEYNSDLSLRRATAVRDLLIASGVDAQRIQTFGHGALTSFDGSDPIDLDELALQRRVIVTFYRDADAAHEMTAQVDVSSD